MDEKVTWTWWLYIIVALYVTWEVVMRYFFDSPHTWFEETSVFMCVVAAFLGTGKSITARMQIVLPLIYSRFSRNTLRIVDIGISILTIIICVLVIIAAVTYAFFLNSVNAVYISDLRTPISVFCYT